MDDENEIAIVGVGCRFPGADNLEEFWRVLVNGENHVIEIPKERWNNEAFYSENKEEKGKHYVKRAGFIKNHDEWDHRFFGVSEAEAARVDPQQRYVLECTHMAIEDGGITRADLDGSQTGVYLGVMNDDYKSICRQDINEVSNYCAVGKSTTIIASRVSYTYNLRGPCMVIDTACSSAMVAMHLGSQALRTGECTMAICGGVSSITSPNMFIDLCKARMMSEVGQCQTFCDSADGYARGEGCGIVMLKTVKKAIEDGNKIWAVLRTGSNQDGHAATPITAPSGEQQERLLRTVYSQYGVDPASLQYVELHGTGTPIGDPTEVGAIGRFISSQRQTGDGGHTGETSEKMGEGADKNNLIKIGSVKTNIGHTESAAGAAGLIKVLLMMKHGKLVPSLHLKKDKSNLNKKIDLDKYSLDVALDVEDWVPNKDGDRISCVNSFGFGGSNSHAIVIQRHKLKTPFTPVAPICPYNVFCLSAMDKTALRGTIERFGADIVMNDLSPSDIAFTSAFHRDHFAYRTLIFGTNIDEVTEQTKLKVTNLEKMKSPSKTRLIFVFCGVGTTWNGMCSEMMKTQPVFRAKVEEIDNYLQPLTGWQMSDKFDNDTTEYSDPLLNHISIFCTQLALFAVWEHWGVLPDVIVGQSVGEVAAAVASGSLSLKDGVTVIYHRSRILAKKTGGQMMVVGNMPFNEIKDICTRYDNKVTIAVYNSPTSCTLSGNADVMENIKAELESMNTQHDASILIRPLSVQCAYHSHHVESCMSSIEHSLSGIGKSDRSVDHISTVTGELANADEFQTGKYWANNIRQPVQFMQALLKATRENMTNVFLELGPRQVLRAHLKNILANTLTGECLPSMNAKKENTSMYSSLCDLFELGVSLQLNHVAPSKGLIVEVPRYAFNKSKILQMTEQMQCFLRGIQSSSDSHMYLRPSGANGGEFRIEINKRTTPFVYDHFLQEATLVPGATYVEAAFAVGHSKSKRRAEELSVSVDFVNTFAPAEDKQYLLDIDVKETDKDYEYHVYKDGRTLCRGTISERKESEKAIIDIEAIRDGCMTYLTKEDSYKCLERLEFKYGESLSLIKQSWTSSSECIIEIVVPEIIRAQTKTTFLHPSIVDTMFQTFGVLSTTGSGEGPTLPKGVGSIVINRPSQDRMFCYSRLVKATTLGNHYNCLLLSPEGYIIAEIQDFYTKTVRITYAPNQSIVYNLTWKEHTGDRKEKDEDSEKDDGAQNGKSIIVFGTNRFTTSFRPMKTQTKATHFNLDVTSTETQHIYKRAFSEVHNPGVVIFAACYHIEQLKEGKQDIYEIAKNTFLCLALLIKTMIEMDYTMPIFVVTENVIADPTLEIHASNICGGELWGMVRSAMSETAYPDIRLVDMPLTKENVNAFEYLTRRKDPNCNEYVIHEGKIYTSEFVEDSEQNHEPSYCEIKPAASDTLSLKSAHPTKVVKPHFQICQGNGANGKSQTPSYVKVRLLSVALHDESIYQTTSDSGAHRSTLWPEINESGYQVVALEGSGFIEDKKKNGKKIPVGKDPIGFCFPVNVSSTVEIPPKCVFEVSTLPVYIPGLMTTSVILWNLAEASKHSVNVIVVTDDDSSPQCQMFEHLMAKQKKTHITRVLKDHLCDLQPTPVSSAHTIVLLTHVNTVHLTRLQEKIECIQRIVSIDVFLSKPVQQWLVHCMKETRLHICNTAEMFSAPELSEKIPKIHSWMKSLNENLKMQVKKNNDGTVNSVKNKQLHLPFPTLSLNDDPTDYAHISLKVFKEEIFRRDGCYVIVGGLTGLGWELLQLMAKLGAGYLATFSRRQPTDETRNEINKIQDKYGCRVFCLQVDITNLKQLEEAMKDLQSTIKHTSVKGIFHGGGVINDKLLNNMSTVDAEKALLPKVLGTWNLHCVTKDLQLDFFVMHSSIVSMLGNAGQCNYAAGNSYQDSFAHYRRSMGLCGQSINWGALSLGMATEHKDRETKLKSMGFFYLSREEISSCFLRALMTNTPQVTFSIMDWSRLQNAPTMKLYPHKYKTLLGRYGRKEKGTIDEDNTFCFDMDTFGKADTEEQTKMFEELIKAMLSETLVVDKDTLNRDTHFVTLGIDSMAAQSLSSSVADATGVRIPVVQLLSDSTTIGTLTVYLKEKIKSTTPNERRVIVDESKKFDKFLEGNVTFMQSDFLRDYEKSPKNGELFFQADFELKGLTFKSKDWRFILTHLLKINPELRRVYIFSENGEQFESRLIPSEIATIELLEVPFDSICNEDSTDCRHEHIFDLTKDLPIKFQIAIRGKKTRMRMFIHSVIGDLRSMAMFFKDIGAIVSAYMNNQDLPEKDNQDILPAEYVRKALAPKMLDLHQFWKNQMALDIEPFTFAKDFQQPMESCNRHEINIEVPHTLVDSILSYVQKDGNSLYNFAIATYTLVLHEMTRKSLVPIYTNIDMSAHVPQLASMVTRSTNAIPIIGDLRKMGTVREYLTKTADLLREMTEKSAFPYTLIEDVMPSDMLRKNIGRHRFLMHSMRNLNNTTKHRHVTVKVMNAYHKRYVYETVLYVVYDLEAKHVELEFAYNTASLRHEEAFEVPRRMIELMQDLVEHDSSQVSDVLKVRDEISSSSGRNTPSLKRMGNNADEYADNKTTGYIHTDGTTTEYIDTNPGQGGMKLLREDKFLKQTSQGWDHEVYVIMTKDMCKGEVLLQWGRGKAKNHRSVPLDTVQDVQVKRINGSYGILIRLPKRQVVLKTLSREQAIEWLNVFKSAYRIKDAADTNNEKPCKQNLATETIRL